MDCSSLGPSLETRECNALLCPGMSINKLIAKKHTNIRTNKQQNANSPIHCSCSLQSILFRSQRMVGTQCGVTGPIVTSHVVEA